MKSSDWRGGTMRKHSSECERRHTQTRTFFHSLFTPLKRKWHHPVWWQRATVPATRGSQSGLALVQRSKKHTGGFCLLFACITWPWFCVMFTLKDNMCRSFLKWPLPAFFRRTAWKLERGQIRQYSMTAWKVDSFFFPGPISSSHGKPPAQTVIYSQIKENWPQHIGWEVQISCRDTLGQLK